MAQPKIGSSTLPSPVAPAGTTFSGSTLTAISARSANDIWAVGSFSAAKGTTSNSFTLTMHFNGSAWTIVPSPNPAVATPAGVSQALNGVAEIAPDDAGAAGDRSAQAGPAGEVRVHVAAR